MPLLRRFIGGVFSFLSVIFILVSLTSVPFAIRAIRGEDPLAYSHRVMAHPASPPGVRIFAGLFVLLLPPILGICFGMAAWAIRRGRPSARPWGIAASIAVLVMSAPFMAIFLFSPRSHIPGAGSFFLVNGAIFLFGVLALAAFCPPSASRSLAPKVQLPRMAGDGTGAWADVVAWIVAVIGYFALTNWWYRWAHSQGLRLSSGLSGWAELLLALLVSTALHEAGHAVAGLCLGMKLRLFAVGPFRWTVRDGKWTFKFDMKKAFSAGGATACVPATTDWQCADEIIMIAAGPAASFATGCFASVLALSAKGAWFEQRWEFLIMLASISLIAAAVNLLPLRPDAIYSDGAQIYQLLKGGPWADLHRVQALVTSTLVTRLRPLNYDYQAIKKAEESFTQGIHALLLRLYESSYFMDRGQFDEARRAFEEAESLFPGAEPLVNAGLLTSFVYRSAVLSRDAAAARKWWQRMEAAKPDHFGVSYWLAKSALMWMEGNLDEAAASCQKASAMAANLPDAGDYEFDRDRCKLIQAELDRAGRERREKAYPEAPYSMVYAAG